MRRFSSVPSTSPERLNMDEASEQVSDQGSYTTPGGDAATEDFVPSGTRNKKARTSAVSASDLQNAAREAHARREANDERRHEETIEERKRQHAERIAQTNRGLEQEAWVPAGGDRPAEEKRGGASNRAQRSMS